MVELGLSLGEKCLRKSVHRTIYTNYNLTAVVSQPPATLAIAGFAAEFAPEPIFYPPTVQTQLIWSPKKQSVNLRAKKLPTLDSVNYKTLSINLLTYTPCLVQFMFNITQIRCNVVIWCYQNIIRPVLECI